MRTLLSATNVDVVTGDFPKGRVRDKVGVTPGTLYEEKLVGDLYQLVQKLIIDAGITENGLPDNVSNGYQILVALNSKIRKRYKIVEKTASYDWSVGSEDEVDFVRYTGTSTVELTLPTAASNEGREIIINGVAAVTIGYTGSVEGAVLSNNTGGLGNQLRMISDGSTWRVANLPYTGV